MSSREVTKAQKYMKFFENEIILFLKKSYSESLLL